MGITSNILAIFAAFFGVLAAVAAGLSAIQANRETSASVRKAQAEAGVKIADAKREAAKANERAAALERETAIAKLQLAKIESGVGARQLTAMQKQEIINALRGKVSAAFIVMGVDRDGESSVYAVQIGNALQAAGLKARTGPVPYLGIGLISAPGNPILMYSPLSPEATAPNNHDPVYTVLSKVLGPISHVRDVVSDGHLTRPDYYYIQVGHRSAPNLQE